MSRRLSELSTRCALAIYQIGSCLIRYQGRRRQARSANEIYSLVGNLDGIREHYTGKKITRSLQGRCFERNTSPTSAGLRDPDIGDGTIEKAMKDRIKRRDDEGLTIWSCRSDLRISPPLFTCGSPDLFVWVCTSI